MTLAELVAFAGRHPLLSLALAGITLAILYNEIAGRFSGFRRVGPAQLTGMINRDDALVVDLRPAADFEKGHIAGAKNVQMAQFDPENKVLAPAKALPVVLVCASGARANRAVAIAKKLGYDNAQAMAGGLKAWREASLPVEKA